MHLVGIEGGNAPESHEDRLKRVQAELAGVPVGSFTTEELQPLFRVLGIGPALGMAPPGRQDLDIVERRLERIKEG